METDTEDGALLELRGRPLRKCVKRRLKGLGKAPVKEAVEDPRTWNNHPGVPTREQVRGCSHVEHQTEECVLRSL